MYSPALQRDYSTSNGCGGAACNYELFTENAVIAKKTCKSTIWTLVLLYVQIFFFPCRNEMYYHFWISHPEGLFMRL